MSIEINRMAMWDSILYGNVFNWMISCSVDLLSKSKSSVLTAATAQTRPSKEYLW